MSEAAVSLPVVDSLEFDLEKGFPRQVLPEKNAKKWSLVGNDQVIINLLNESLKSTGKALNTNWDTKKKALASRELLLVNRVKSWQSFEIEDSSQFKSSARTMLLELEIEAQSELIENLAETLELIHMEMRSTVKPDRDPNGKPPSQPELVLSPEDLYLGRVSTFLHRDSGGGWLQRLNQMYQLSVNENNPKEVAEFGASFQSRLAQLLIESPGRGTDLDAKIAKTIQTQIEQHTQAGTYDFARRHLKGAVAVVTLREILALESFASKVKMEEIILREDLDLSWATDVIFKLADNKFLQVQVKSVSDEIISQLKQSHPEDYRSHLVQEVTSQQTTYGLLGQEYLSSQQASDMLAVRSSDDLLKDAAEVITLVVFVPNNDFDDVNTYTGYLKTQPDPVFDDIAQQIGKYVIKETHEPS